MSLSSRTVIGWTFAFLFVGFLALLGIVAMNLLAWRADAGLFRRRRSRRAIRAAPRWNCATRCRRPKRRSAGFWWARNEIYLAPYDVARDAIAAADVGAVDAARALSRFCADGAAAD